MTAATNIFDPTAMYPGISKCVNVTDPWSLNFMSREGVVVLAKWDEEEKVFKRGDRVAEVNKRWGDKKTVHVLAKETLELDPDGDCDTEWVFALENLDFNYLNIVDPDLSVAWTQFQADPPFVTKKSQLLKNLERCVRQFYEERGEEQLDPRHNISKAQQGEFKKSN